MNIDGIEYVPASETVTGTDHVIVIATNGWIFEGYAVQTGEHITLTRANVVRSWGNGKGIGGLADRSNINEYKRDFIGTITVHAVVAVIECRW